MSWRVRFVGCCRAGAMLAVAVLAACEPKQAPPLPDAFRVTGAWMRPADSGRTAAVYFALHSQQSAVDTLVGVQSADAAGASLHISIQRGRTMRMTPVSSLPVPPRDSVVFQSLGAHVMLEGLARPLVAGDSVAVTLTFGSGRALPFVASVRQPQ